MIRVLHVLPWVASGGVEARRLTLAQMLDGKRFQQAVICADVSDEMRTAFTAADVPVWDELGVGSILRFGPYLRLARRIRAWRPHILHGAVFEGQIWSGLIGVAMNVPIVITEETTLPEPPAKTRSWPMRLLQRASVSGTAACVAISRPVHRFLADNGIGDLTRLVTITNAARAAPPAPPDAVAAERQRLGIPADAPVVGTVCRLFDNHKRVSDLIAAMARVRARNPQAYFLVVGDGPDRERLEEQATRALGTGFCFAGHRSDHGLFFALMDLFCLPSAFEGFGLVFAEAMHAGLPCIGTNVGGIPEIIVDGVTGHLVPRFDPANLAAAIDRLLADPAMRRSMGAAGRARAGEHFSIDRYVREVDALYVNCLRRRGQ